MLARQAVDEARPLNLLRRATMTLIVVKAVDGQTVDACGLTQPRTNKALQ